MKLSAVFESADHAELAVRQISDAGINISRRRVSPLSQVGGDEPQLPHEMFYFPATSEFYTGMTSMTGMSYTNAVFPGFPFFPMVGQLSGDSPSVGEARLELEVDDRDAERARDILTQRHATSVNCY